MRRSTAASATPRLTALDAARALGVVAMVVGHTLDAVLWPAARQSSAMGVYWHVRGFTAPLFLTVAGWASALAFSAAGAERQALLWHRVRRATLLVVIGYTLRWPGWGLDRLLAGDREVWAHFLAFDVLHCIGLALLVGSFVLSVQVSRLGRLIGLALLIVASVALGAGAARPGSADGLIAGLPRSIPAMALAQVVGGTSSFPVVPWAAYFFAGAIVGLALPRDRARALPLTLAGLVLTVAAVAGFSLSGRGPGDPVLVGYRLGVTLLVLAALTLIPGRWGRGTAWLGRRSLGIYALHIAIVYGWSTYPGLSWRVGPTLSAPAALGVAALVLAASALLDRCARGLIPTAHALYGAIHRRRRRREPEPQHASEPGRE